MKMNSKLARNQGLAALVSGLAYFVILCLSIYAASRNSLIDYKISPYIIGSEPIDFFFPLFVSVPFAWMTYFMRKDYFTENVLARYGGRKYIAGYFALKFAACFLFVFAANLGAVIFSVSLNIPNDGHEKMSLAAYVLGQMQMRNPILFGLLWAAKKALLGVMICIFSADIAWHVRNFFLAMLIPYIYVILENFVTAILGIPRISLTSSIVVDRLQPSPADLSLQMIGIAVFACVILGGHFWMKKEYE